MFSAAALVVTLGLVEAEPMTPRLSADFDGDGVVETATAARARGGVRLEIRDAAGKKKNSVAQAPASAADLIRVSLTAAPLGSSGSLLEVLAATDASECRSVWRYHDAALTRIPIRGADGRPLPDCEAPGLWSHRWEREAEDTPSFWIRERSESVESGALRRTEVFTFAGFSLDADPKRSRSEINGLPIPAWYETRLYTRTGREMLAQRFHRAAWRSEPQLRIEADRVRGVFALRFVTASGEIVAPLLAFSAIETQKASLIARSGEKTFRASVQLEGDGTVPVEVRVDGLSPELDVIFEPAMSWRGQVREVFPSAGDEIASRYLVADWAGPERDPIQIRTEGTPPYRVRMGNTLFTLDMDHAPPEMDFVLLPVEEGGHGWAVVMRGPNAFQRTPMVCSGPDAARTCRPDGASQTLRRIGARVNAN